MGEQGWRGTGAEGARPGGLGWRGRAWWGDRARGTGLERDRPGGAGPGGGTALERDRAGGTGPERGRARETKLERGRAGGARPEGPAQSPNWISLTGQDPPPDDDYNDDERAHIPMTTQDICKANRILCKKNKRPTNTKQLKSYVF